MIIDNYTYKTEARQMRIAKNRTWWILRIRVVIELPIFNPTCFTLLGNQCEPIRLINNLLAIITPGFIKSWFPKFLKTEFHRLRLLIYWNIYDFNPIVDFGLGVADLELCPLVYIRRHGRHRSFVLGPPTHHLDLYGQCDGSTAWRRPMQWHPVRSAALAPTGVTCWYGWNLASLLVRRYP